MFCRVAGKTSRQLLRLFMEATHPRLQSDQNPITRSQSACCRKWTPKCLVTSLGLFLLVWCLRSLATFEQAIQVLDQVAKSTVRLLLKWSATLHNNTIGTYPILTSRLRTSSQLSPCTSLQSANCHNNDFSPSLSETVSAITSQEGTQTDAEEYRGLSIVQKNSSNAHM